MTYNIYTPNNYICLDLFMSKFKHPLPITPPPETLILYCPTYVHGNIAVSGGIDMQTNLWQHKPGT